MEENRREENGIEQKRDIWLVSVFFLYTCGLQEAELVWLAGSWEP